MWNVLIGAKTTQFDEASKQLLKSNVKEDKIFYCDVQKQKMIYIL